MWCLLWQCTYGLLSIVLYGIVVWLVIREKRFFCSSFVKLTITLSVVNVITWITFFFLLRIPNHAPENSQFGLFLENFPWPTLLRVGMFMGFYLGYCQHLSLFFIIFHRMRAITWPFDREAMWDTQYWITVLFICLFPLGFTFTLLQTDAHFIYRDQIGGYVLEPVDVTQVWNVMQLTIFSWIITILGVIANATTIIMLCKRSMSSNYRRELHLFLISFVGFTVQALQSAVAFGYYVSKPESSLRYFCIFILPYCNDLFSLGLPYFFLVFNVRLRKCFFELPPFRALTQSFAHKCDKSCQHLAPSDAEASVVMVMRIHVKSQYGADFRRYSIVVGTGLPLPTLEEFLIELFKIHKLSPEQSQTVTVSYADRDGSNLPISNDDNLHKALNDKPNLLRINLQKKGESYEEQFGYGLTHKSIEEKKKRSLSISSPQEFRRVSSILDADTLPTELRRVQLCKTYTNKPLGFYIRDGTNFINTLHGSVMTNGIFISRLLPHGLAASTNILNVDDEILEVNGICVKNKSLDQVTDIMLANATNLILTTRPAAPMPPIHYYNSLPPPYSMPGHGYHMMPYPPIHYSPVISPRHPAYPGHYMAHLQPHNLYNQENLDDKYRMSPPVAQFSRESTYRLSDKTAKLTLNETRTPPRRPMSVHPGWMYPNYGMGY